MVITYTSFSSGQHTSCLSERSRFQILDRRLVILRENFHRLSQTFQTCTSIALQAGLRQSPCNQLFTNPALQGNIRVRGATVGWGSALQAGKSRARFPIGPLEFFTDLTFWPHSSPGVDLASDRNEYQEYVLGGRGGRCVWLTTLPPSCADCYEIWEIQPPRTIRACPDL